MTPIEIAEEFYSAFKALDAERMNALYHETAFFEDPAFGKMNATDTQLMWSMLCESQKDKGFELSFNIIDSDQKSVKVEWQAWYIFSKTGKRVHNKIQAHLKIENGKIIHHRDDFNLHRWANQALGVSGWLLGGTGFFRRKLQQQTHTMLAKYKAKIQTNS